MKTLRVVNTLPELERLLQDVGSLVPLSVAAISLGVHNSRVYQLGETGRLRIFAVFGSYQTPLVDVKDRIQRMAKQGHSRAHVCSTRMSKDLAVSQKTTNSELRT